MGKYPDYDGAIMGTACRASRRRYEQVDKRLESLDRGLESFRDEVGRRFDGVDRKIDGLQWRMTSLMLGTWLTLMLAIVLHRS
jgi:hypothetical protein